MHPRKVMALKWLVLFGLFWLAAWERLDPDFGWHLQAGNYIRAHGIPAHDVFTYTAPNFPWIDHEWGNDVIVSLLYGAGGYGLLTVLYSVLWSSALIVAAARARLFILITAGAAMLPYAGVRPIGWTVLGLAICLRILNSSEKRWRWALLPLFIVWANLHGGFVIGLAAIGFYAVLKREAKLFGLLLLSILATFVNVYGPSVYVEVARTLFDPTLHQQVTEWTPFLLYGVSRPFVCLWAGGTVIFIGTRWREYFRFSSFMLLGIISASRNVPLFVIASVAELNDYFIQGQALIPKGLDRGRQMVLWTISTFVIFSVASGAWISLQPLNGNRERSYPAQAVAYLQTHGCDGGHIFNDYNYGGYLIWKLPGQPVYIDGRMPSWRAPDGHKYMDVYFNLRRHPATYSKVFQKYDIQCTLLRRAPENKKLIVRLKHDHWKVAVQNSYSVLLLKP